MKMFFLIMVLVTSCASKWKPSGVSYEKRVWRNCSLELDLHEEKGWCYKAQECKKTAILRRRKCRTVPLYCAYDDMACYEKYKLDQKVLGPR